MKKYTIVNAVSSIKECENTPNSIYVPEGYKPVYVTQDMINRTQNMEARKAVAKILLGKVRNY